MTDPESRKEAEDWWQTALIRMEPNQIDIRGHLVGQLDPFRFIFGGSIMNLVENNDTVLSWNVR